LQTVLKVFPWQRESLQLPQATALLVGAGSNEGSFAAPPSGGAGAAKIAARLALDVSAGVAVWAGAALAREAISNRTTARTVDLSFMRVSFEERFTKEPRRVSRLLQKGRCESQLRQDPNFNKRSQSAE
jgi:hypothetical protein